MTQYPSILELNNTYNKILIDANLKCIFPAILHESSQIFTVPVIYTNKSNRTESEIILSEKDFTNYCNPYYKLKINDTLYVISDRDLTLSDANTTLQILYLRYELYYKDVQLQSIITNLVNQIREPIQKKLQIDIGATLSTLNDAIDVVKIQTKKVQIKRDYTDLKELFEDAIALFDTPIELIWECECKSLYVDRIKLKYMIMTFLHLHPCDILHVISHVYEDKYLIIIASTHASTYASTSTLVDSSINYTEFFYQIHIANTVSPITMSNQAFKRYILEHFAKLMDGSYNSSDVSMSICGYEDANTYAKNTFSKLKDLHVLIFTTAENQWVNIKKFIPNTTFIHDTFSTFNASIIEKKYDCIIYPPRKSTDDSTTSLVDVVSNVLWIESEPNVEEVLIEISNHFCSSF